MTKFAHIPLNELLNDLAESRMDMRAHQKLGFPPEYNRIAVNGKIIETIIDELGARKESVPVSQWPDVP